MKIDSLPSPGADCKKFAPGFFFTKKTGNKYFSVLTIFEKSYILTNGTQI